MDFVLLFSVLLHWRKPMASTVRTMPAQVSGAGFACGSEGASSSSGDRVFELDLGGEAVAITPNRQNRQLPAAMLVRYGAVLRFRPAVNLDAVPLAGMADIREQQVVLLSPEERNSVEAFVR